MENHYPVADLETGYIFAESSNDSRGFMAKDPRCGMGTGCDLLQVRATDAAGVNANEYFSRAHPGNRHCLHANIIDAAVDSCLHRRGDDLLTN